MIEIKDLEEYIRNINTGNTGVTNLEMEYRAEIIKRLRERDALIKGIEALIATMSNEVDK